MTPEIVMSVRSFSSKAALTEFLAQDSAPAILLGAEADAPREFFSFELIDRSRAKRVNIAVLSFGIGVRPSWTTYQNHFLLGFNFRVAVIDLDALSLVHNFDIQTLFYEFIPVPDMPKAYVLCATALVCIEPPGSVLWRVDTDVVTHSEVRGHTARLRFMDDPPLVIDLRDGRIIAPSQG